MKFVEPCFALAAALSLFSVVAVADTTAPEKSYLERKADLKTACDTCAKGVKKDPGEWDIGAALGFNVTQGNGHTTALNA